MPQLEICTFTYASTLAAARAGADRIELCDNPLEGGTTPSAGMIAQVREAISIQLYPIIRPRGGDFLYSEAEFALMRRDVLLCKQLGCDGVVIGLLHADGTVDRERTTELVQLAWPMGVTFHRAFDRSHDPFAALEAIIEAGCERILTSGQVPNAHHAMPLLAELVERAMGRISIMPGSGVRFDNAREILQQTGATEIHSSARIKQASAMQYQNPLMQETAVTYEVDEAEVRAMRKAIDDLIPDGPLPDA
jgi:copper homeostasis protein